MTDQTDAGRGTRAEGPTQIPARGWKDILLRVKDEVTRDHVSVVSAGVAFFGLLAIFPAVTAVISIAGWVLDPQEVASQIDSIAALLPQNAASIIQDQIVQVTGGSDTATGFAAILGLVLALYGAMKGMMTLMEGMNIAYDEQEQRGFFRLYLTGFVLTVVMILGVLLAFGAMLVLPAVTTFLPLPAATESLVSWLKWPLLTVLTMLGLSLIYRFGPCREDAQWRWITPGAVIATILWLVGTVAFSIYAQNFGSYNETYGTLGGVIILLTWLWLSSFIVLAGAELNSEMEHQTRRDTTTGAPVPMGARGAIKADTTPEGLSGPDAPKRSMGAEGDDTETAQEGPRRPRGPRPTFAEMVGATVGLAAAGALEKAVRRKGRRR
ncbi:YihY/virulence factor BrkB family protein [Pseudoroseicyclus aestuarii]|uniref:Membrane protein n=1 Tax=Pseudoroseicyclus aestuarii TaxID=1795041 RepID=A0A318SR26_9RHOB|nr:YihY/virulence factor BrkB family protein [Pseudoroseicyclus aestuarii]PYE84123.1 membrane protein [Pseudoroseicyclus aestuarii]